MLFFLQNFLTYRYKTFRSSVSIYYIIPFCVNIVLFQSALWWRFRCFLIHQQVLEEKSPILHDQLVSLGDKLQQSDLIKYDTDLKVLLHLEIAQMHLMYHEVLPSNQALETAVNGAGIRLNLTGIVNGHIKIRLD